MHSVLTPDDVLAILSRSNLPTVLTEGAEDYRVLRKVEERLADIGVNFLPVGGRSNLLEVWERLPHHRQGNTIAFADLDLWLFLGIPEEYHAENIIFTLGYSIENDIFIDADLLRFCDFDECGTFFSELDIISTWYAQQINLALNGECAEISDHVNSIINISNSTTNLDVNELALKEVILKYYMQTLRGKNLMQLLVRQLNKKGRFARFGHKQLYEIASSQIGPRFCQLERDFRNFFKRSLSL